MIHINLFISLLCLWLFVYLNNKFLKVCRINKVRFELFALRDRLAIIAMRGDVDQKGEEYRTLRHILNESIRVFDSFSIVSFLKYIIRLEQDKELKKRLDRMISSWKAHGNEEFRDIVYQYFKIMRHTFDSHTRFLMKVFLPMLLVIMPPFVVLRKIFKQKADSLQAAEQYLQKRTDHHTCIV